MSDITISGSISITKNGLTVSDAVTLTADISAVGKFGSVQTIGTSAELVVFPSDLVTEGVRYIWLRNIDATNFITVSQKTGANTNPISKLSPGDFMLLRNPLSATNDPGIWAQADTAPCNLQIVASGT